MSSRVDSNPAQVPRRVREHGSESSDASSSSNIEDDVSSYFRYSVNLPYSLFYCWLIMIHLFLGSFLNSCLRFESLGYFGKGHCNLLKEVPQTHICLR